MIKEYIFRKSGFDISLFLTLIAEVSFVTLCFLILQFRLESVIRDSLYGETTGGECASLYGIYKAWIGESVYQPLQKSPSISTFNFLFYYGYGLISRLLTANAEHLPLVSRLFTLSVVFFFLAAIICYLYFKTKGFAKKPDAIMFRLIILLIPFILYFGPFSSWWYLTARPDIIAVSFELVALILFINLLEKDNSIKAIFMTFFFLLAWAMKQTTVLVWLGVLIALILQRRFKQAIVSLLFFCVCFLIISYLLGWPYIEHTLLANAANIFMLKQPLILVAKTTFITGSYIFIPALFFVVYYFVTRKDKNLVFSIFAICLVTTLLGGALASKKIGSSRNYYFSFFFVAGLFILQYLIYSWQTMNEIKRRLAMRVMFLSFCLGSFLSSLYLIHPNQFGRLNFIAPLEKEEVQRMRRIIYLSAKPVLVEYPYYALPWNSGQRLSDLVDCLSYGPAVRQGLMAASIEKRIKDKYYAEAFVFEGGWDKLLESAGYKKVSRPGRFVHFLR